MSGFAGCPSGGTELLSSASTASIMGASPFLNRSNGVDEPVASVGSALPKLVDVVLRGWVTDTRLRTTAVPRRRRGPRLSRAAWWA